MARKKKETPVSPPVVDLPENEIYGGLHEAELKRAHREIEALVTKKNVETANVQNAYKAMKSKGGDTDAYKWASKLLGMDRSTSMVRLRLFLEMLCRLDPGPSQGDMFGDDDKTFAQIAADVAARFGAAPAPVVAAVATATATATATAQAEPWADPAEEDEGEDAADRDGLTAETGAEDDDAEGPAYDIGDTLADEDDPALSDGGVIYNAGYQAGVDGEAEDACPHVNGTAADLWRKGWAQGLAARTALIGSIPAAEAVAAAPVH